MANLYIKETGRKQSFLVENDNNDSDDSDDDDLPTTIAFNNSAATATLATTPDTPLLLVTTPHQQPIEEDPFNNIYSTQPQIQSQSSDPVKPPILPPRPSKVSHGSSLSTRTTRASSQSELSRDVFNASNTTNNTFNNRSESMQLLGLDNTIQVPPPISHKPSYRKLGSLEKSSSSFKLKDDLIIPDVWNSFKSLPLPSNMTNSDVYHKGPAKDFVFSGFYAVTGADNIRIWYLPTGENMFTANLLISRLQIFFRL